MILLIRIEQTKKSPKKKISVNKLQKMKSAVEFGSHFKVKRQCGKLLATQKPFSTKKMNKQNSSIVLSLCVNAFCLYKKFLFRFELDSGMNVLIIGKERVC